jgi:hypothetical protein
LLIGILAMCIIPRRPIDCVFLRAFAADRESDLLLRSIRRKVGRQHRITGVVAPTEKKRIARALLVFIMPISFSASNITQASAVRHTVYLTGSWQDGVDQLLHAANVAVIACRTTTQNLAWELRGRLKYRERCA